MNDIVDQIDRILIYITFNLEPIPKIDRIIARWFLIISDSA